MSAAREQVQLNQKDKPEEKNDKPLITLQDFSEIHLFMLNFAEKLIKSSKYIDTPKNTKQILKEVTDPENEKTAI
jgi:hypothetical protein